MYFGLTVPHSSHFSNVFSLAESFTFAPDQQSLWLQNMYSNEMPFMNEHSHSMEKLADTVNSTSRDEPTRVAMSRNEPNEPWPRDTTLLSNEWVIPDVSAADNKNTFCLTAFQGMLDVFSQPDPSSEYTASWSNTSTLSSQAMLSSVRSNFLNVGVATGKPHLDTTSPPYPDPAPEYNLQYPVDAEKILGFYTPLMDPNPSTLHAAMLDFNGSSTDPEFHRWMLLGAQAYFFRLTGCLVDAIIETYYPRWVSTEALICALCLVRRLVEREESCGGRQTRRVFPSLKETPKGTVFPSDPTASRVFAALLRLSTKFHDDREYELKAFCAAYEEDMGSSALGERRKLLLPGMLGCCEWRIAKALGFDLWTSKADYKECASDVLRLGWEQSAQQIVNS